MSILGAIFDSTYLPESDLSNPVSWLLDFVGGSKTSSGVRVSSQGALRLGAYFACIRNISEDIGKVPFKLFEALASGGKNEIPEHPVYKLLHRNPNPLMSSQLFRETLTQWALGWGGGIAEIEFVGTTPVNLWPIHPSRVYIERIDVDGEKTRMYHVINNDNTRASLNHSEVFHVRGLGDEDRGYSVAALAAETIGRGIAVRKFASKFFGEGATYSGVFTAPGVLNDAARRRMREHWPVGLPGAHKPLFLEGGTTYSPISIPPEDAQMLETSKESAREIYQWFRIPPHKVGDLERATFSNIAMQKLEYADDTLLPWFVRWEQEAWRKLLTEDERDRLVPEHVLNGLLRADPDARGKFYEKMWRMGVFTVNTILNLENMNPIGPSGDLHFVPVNFTTIEQVMDAIERGEEIGSNEGAKAPEDDEDSDEEREGEDETGDEEDAFGSDRMMEAVKLAQTKVLIAAFERVFEMERKAVLRLAKKHADDRTAFETACGEFRDKLRKYMDDSLRPGAEALIGIIVASYGIADTGKIDRARGVLSEFIGDTMRDRCSRWSEDDVASGFDARAAYENQELSVALTDAITASLNGATNGKCVSC